MVCVLCTQPSAAPPPCRMLPPSWFPGAGHGSTKEIPWGLRDWKILKENEGWWTVKDEHGWKEHSVDGDGIDEWRNNAQHLECKSHYMQFRDVQRISRKDYELWRTLKDYNINTQSLINQCSRHCRRCVHCPLYSEQIMANNPKIQKTWANADVNKRWYQMIPAYTIIHPKKCTEIKKFQTQADCLSHKKSALHPQTLLPALQLHPNLNAAQW